MQSDTLYVIDGRSLYETDSQGRIHKESTVYSPDYDVKLERASDNQAMIRNGKDGMEMMKVRILFLNVWEAPMKL